MRAVLDALPGASVQGAAEVGVAGARLDSQQGAASVPVGLRGQEAEVVELPTPPSSGGHPRLPPRMEGQGCGFGVQKLRNVGRERAGSGRRRWRGLPSPRLRGTGKSPLESPRS